MQRMKVTVVLLALVASIGVGLLLGRLSGGDPLAESFTPNLAMSTPTPTAVATPMATAPAVATPFASPASPVTKPPFANGIPPGAPPSTPESGVTRDGRDGSAGFSLGPATSTEWLAMR